MRRDDGPKLHSYDYKVGQGGHFWFCRLCSALCRACKYPCERCAHRIENEDCPHNQELIEQGLIEPISDLRYARDAPDPEHIKDTA